jgi:NADPH2:quinone reductase
MLINTESRHLISVQTNGAAFAEYITRSWIKVFAVPSTIDARTAASASLQGTTALTFIEEAYKAMPGDYALVHAAAGGLGLILCQLLKSRGVHVIGSVSTEDKARLAKENGAEFVIVYTKENLLNRVMEITDGQGVHGIYDGVGKAT